MLKTILQAIRLPFLILTPVCVLLGTATAYASGEAVSWCLLPIVFLAAISAHCSVNALNEYSDYRTGLDLNTQRTPFSGGSGALPGNPGAATAVLWVGLIGLVVTVLCGLFLIMVRGWELMLAGAVGTMLVAFYTPWINRQPWLCLIAPGIGFGSVMVLGTHWVLVDKLSALAAVASLVPFLLVNNLLLLNQFPDIEADRAVGRRHLLIVYGTRAGAITYALGVLLCALVILLGYVFKIWNVWPLVALLPIILATVLAMAVLRNHSALGNRTDILGANVLVTLVTPTLLALALFVG